MSDCVLCHREVKENVDPTKIITCSLCVQNLLSASKVSNIVYRDKLISAGKPEEARSVDSFITEEEITNEPTKNFRRALVGKRHLRKIRTSNGKKPFRRNRLLDKKWAQVR